MSSIATNHEDAALPNPLPVSAASLPLPTGAATESTLSSLNGKVTACNTGAVAGTVAVSNVPTSIDVGNFPSVVHVDDNSGSLTVDGTVAVSSIPAVSGTVAITNPLLAAAPIVGQSKIASTGTAVQLGSNALANGVILTAKSTNAAAITVGSSSITNTVNGTGNGYILEPGCSTSIAVDNTNRLYINGTAGDIISFMGC